jgi:hypothetical protein
VVPAQREPGRLDVDDGEPHRVELRVHEPNDRSGV